MKEKKDSVTVERIESSTLTQVTWGKGLKMTITQYLSCGLSQFIAIGDFFSLSGSFSLKKTLAD